jgi:hypothetical protein
MQRIPDEGSGIFAIILLTTFSPQAGSMASQAPLPLPILVYQFVEPSDYKKVDPV